MEKDEKNLDKHDPKPNVWLEINIDLFQGRNSNFSSRFPSVPAVRIKHDKELSKGKEKV